MATNGIAAPCQTVHGVQFFNDSYSCTEHYKNLSWMSKALSSLKSWGNCFCYYATRVHRMMSRVEAKMSSCATINESAATQQRLVVCIHGLSNSPAQFQAIMQEMHPEVHQDTAFYAPIVKDRGKATLDESMQPIFDEITKWSAQGPTKELVLMGISNGGRIAELLATKFANNANITKVRFVSIVGALRGSALVDFAKRWHLSFLVPKNNRKEMPTDSECTQTLKIDWNSVVHEYRAKFEFTFIAAAHDWMVPNYRSTLPEFQANKRRYAIVPNHGHNSVVDKAAKAVATLIFN